MIVSSPPTLSLWVVVCSVNVRLVLSPRGWISVRSPRPVTIYLSAARPERRESPFATWLLASLVLQSCRRGKKMTFFLTDFSLFFPKSYKKAHSRAVR